MNFLNVKFSFEDHFYSKNFLSPIDKRISLKEGTHYHSEKVFEKVDGMLKKIYLIL